MNDRPRLQLWLIARSVINWRKNSDICSQAGSIISSSMHWMKTILLIQRMKSYQEYFTRCGVSTMIFGRTRSDSRRDSATISSDALFFSTRTSNMSGPPGATRPNRSFVVSWPDWARDAIRWQIRRSDVKETCACSPFTANRITPPRSRLRGCCPNPLELSMAAQTSRTR